MQNVMATRKGENMMAPVDNCRRCGNGHGDLTFSKLTNPADEWQWWTMCPALNEPIFLKTYGPIKAPNELTNFADEKLIDSEPIGTHWE